jgi:hypothetical protein
VHEEVAGGINRAIVYCVVGAILALVGLIHDPLGLIFQSGANGLEIRAPNQVWLGYLGAAVVIWFVAWREGAMGSLMDAVTTPPTPDEV